MLYHAATQGAHTDEQILALSANHPDVTISRLWHYSLDPQDVAERGGSAEPQVIDGGLMYARAGRSLPAGMGEDAAITGNALTPERIAHHCLGDPLERTEESAAPAEVSGAAARKTLAG